MPGQPDLVMDRGMAGEDNVEFCARSGRRYIVGTAKNSLAQVRTGVAERGLAAGACRAGRCGSQRRRGGPEVFILCRSAERAGQRAGHGRAFEKRIEEGSRDSDQLPEEDRSR